METTGEITNNMLYDFLKDFKQDFRGFKEEMYSFKREMFEFKSEVNAKFDRLDQRFERVDQRFERVDQKFEKMDQRFGVIEGKQDEDHQILIEMWKDRKGSIFLSRSAVIVIVGLTSLISLLIKFL